MKIVFDYLAGTIDETVFNDALENDPRILEWLENLIDLKGEYKENGKRFRSILSEEPFMTSTKAPFHVTLKHRRNLERHIQISPNGWISAGISIRFPLS